MATEFISLTPESVGGLRGMVYGDQGTGKTSFAVSAYKHPALRKVAVLDTDKGLHSVAAWDSENILFANIESSKDLDYIAEQAMKNQLPYSEFNTWILDTASVWFDRELMAIAQREFSNGKRPMPEQIQLQDYKEAIARLVRITDKFIVGGKHMIMTSQYADYGPTPDKPNRNFERRPKISDKAWAELSARSRFIWYVFQSPNGNVNLLTHPLVLPSGMIIAAKTSNAEFSHRLLEMSHKDESGKNTGVITIGNRFDESVPRLGFDYFYQIYCESLGLKDA